MLNYKMELVKALIILVLVEVLIHRMIDQYMNKNISKLMMNKLPYHKGG